jgi:hypothetical protein
MKTTLFSFVILTIAFCGCIKPEVDYDKITDETDPYYFVSNVPETQKVDSFNLGLEVHLSRNFGPGGDSIRPLMSFITLKELGKQDIKGIFELETLEVILSAKSYKPAFKPDPSENNDKSTVKWLSLTGPELDPKKLADVVCEFKEVKTGKYYSLIARRQEIKISE